MQMGPPDVRLEYRGRDDERRSRSPIQWVISILGLLWFAFFLFSSVLYFLMRGLGDTRDHQVTVAEGLVFAGVILAIGLPGLGLAAWLLRRRG